ncbi:MAG: anaerobic ribonucleoside-triphosphate reductase activating protein [Firmicutes bacterium]|nr:anaerobic ribonucleoside-triphosphate reductase activating protein [Bacillota bacterium]
MILGGMMALSLQDYPGRAAMMLFTQGCNLRCPWCHNPGLVLPHRFDPPLSNEKVLHLLHKRRCILGAVVISGGEPTIQHGLEPFIARLKDLGYAIKLDSNGCRVQVLERLMERELIDYIALDYKLPLRLYHTLGKDVSSQVEASLRLVHTWPVEKRMVRTTVVPAVHTPDILAEMEEELARIGGAAPPHWTKNEFRPGPCVGDDPAG